MPIEEKDLIRPAAAAKLIDISRQAVTAAIQAKKIKKYIRYGILLVSRKEIIDYAKQRWSRSKSVFEEKLLYDKEKGEISVVDAADFLGISAQNLYYMIRMQYIAVEKRGKKGSIYILKKEDVERLKKVIDDKNRKGRFRYFK